MIRNMWKIACTGVLFFGVLFGSCKNNNFEGGWDLFEPKTITGMIDTVTIKVSNLVVADSVVSLGRPGREIGYSGIYYDPQIGTVQTQTYIEFVRTNDSETDRYAQFDSVTLVLRPNGNYYGDTVRRAAFKVHRLAKPIEKREDNFLYSTSSIPLDAQLTDTTHRVKVLDIKNNEFEVKLPHSFGRWLFQGIIKDDDNFKTDKFIKTFPGLAVGAGTGSNCVHGLNLTDTACMIRIYYHINTTYKQEKIMTFKANPNNSFYHLNNDQSNLPYYNSKSAPLPSQQTDNKGIIMSGTPMYTRIEFPYLNELRWLGQIVKIKKAILYVRPVQHSFDTVPLPPKLNIFYFDPVSDTPLSGAIKLPMSGNQNAEQEGNLPKNYQIMQGPYFPQYTFDVTDFISSQLGKVGYEKWALCLIIPEDSRETTIQRLVFGNQDYWYKNENQSRDNRIKLEIIYVAYNE